MFELLIQSDLDLPSSETSLSDIFDTGYSYIKSLDQSEDQQSMFVTEDILGSQEKQGDIFNNMKFNQNHAETIPKTFDLYNDMLNLDYFLFNPSGESTKTLLTRDQKYSYQSSCDQNGCSTPKECSENYYPTYYNSKKQESSSSEGNGKKTRKIEDRSARRIKVSPKKMKKVIKSRPKGSKRLLQVKRDFDYTGVNVSFTIQMTELLTNSAKNPMPENWMNTYNKKLVSTLSDMERNVCTIKRTRYVRIDLEERLQHLDIDVVYEKNPNFSVSMPYEPQYIRYIIDLHSNPILPFNHSRCGLCPYCPELQFYDIKTSAYAQHLSLQHGIYTNNFLTPNPLMLGHYKIKKPANSGRKEKRKTLAHELERDGVVCPCCYEIIGINCSKKTAIVKPLTNYMRHFRDQHIYCKEKIDPYKRFPVEKLSSN